MTLPFPGRTGGQSTTLADVLSGGPMPLAAALQSATEIATALREIHDQGRVHGSVAAANIRMTAEGADLQPARSRDKAGAERDIRDFGAILFHMLTGAPPKTGDLPIPSRLPGPRTGPGGLRVSAIEIAGNCLGDGSYQPTMQQVLTELRLLTVLLKMQEKGDSPSSVQALAPFLVTPVRQPLELEQSEPPVVPLGPASFGQPTQKPQSDVAPKGSPCPKCDSSPVYVSRPRSPFETFLVRMQVPICRCHSCYNRYIVFSGLKIHKEMPAGSEAARRPHRRKR